jgi:arylsulfatase A-like enzyme
MKYFLIFLLGLSVSVSAADKPNIIYILADDLGFGDIQCQNPASKIPTPNIDRMALEGMRFTDFHTNSAVCSPTRYGIMTGRYSFRTRLQGGALSGYKPAMITADRMTVASLLKDKGYYTSCIGKWHMGWDWAKIGPKDTDVDYKKEFKNGPVDVGFDSFFGICASLDIPPYCYCRGKKVSKLPTKQVPRGVFGLRPGLADPDLKPEQAMLDFNTEITTFIKNHKKVTGGKPFFVYYSLPAPHYPVVPAKQFQGKTEVGAYGDYVYEVDWIVGEVFKALQEAGIDENTLVMFTADNGASPVAAGSAMRKGHKPNSPYRGGKSTIWEGGHRVPFIARWPAKIKKESVNDEVFCTTDFMATAAEIVGKKLPDNAGEDSVSMLPAMRGEATPQIRKAVIHHSLRGFFAIRQGKWKYILTNGSGGWVNNWGMKKVSVNKELKGQLYDMSKDTFEENNLVQQYPEIVKKLDALLREIIEAGRSTPGENQENAVKIRIK